MIVPALLLSGCSLFLGRGEAGIDTPSLDRLMGAPEVVQFGGKQLFLTTDMWRDFMPISPPDGKPLIAVFRIVTRDSSDMPPDIRAVAGFVIDGQSVWSTRFADENQHPDGSESFSLVGVARNGPKFGPDIRVEAVVRLENASGRRVLLRAADQYIDATF
jgi:hypothetical protein